MEVANHRPTPTNLQEDRITPLDQVGLNYLQLDTHQPVVKFQPAVTQAESIRCTRRREMAKYTHSTRTRRTAKGNKCMKATNPNALNVTLTCNAVINILHLYAPLGVGLLCSTLSFSSMIRGRYGKRLVKSIQVGAEEMNT